MKELSKLVQRAVLSVFLVVMFFMTAIQLYTLYVQTRQDITDELGGLEDVFADPLTEAIWASSSAQTHALTDAISKLPVVQAIEITNENSGLFISRYIIENPDIKTKFELNYTFEDSSIYLGSVTLYSDTIVLLDRMRVSIVLILIQALVLSIILILSFTAVIRRYLKKPLRGFADTIGNISSQGTGEYHFEFQSPYVEFTPLLKVLKEMGDKITAQIHDIKSINEDLEKRVLARTEENSRLSKAIEQSPATVVITDIKGNIEYVNNKFCRLTGYSREEAIGRNPRVLKSGDMSPENYRDMWEKLSSGQEWQGEFHNKKKNGDDYWELASISPIRTSEGEITHYMAIKEDITRRKEIDRDLEENRNLLSGIIDNSNSLIYVKDLEGKYLLVNHTFEEVVGMAKEKIIGKTAYDFYSDEVADKLWGHDLMVMGSGKPISEEETVHIKGKEYPLISTKFPIRNSNGDIMSLCGISTDISKLKNIEKELIVAKNEAEAATMAKSDFLANMSHEIRTPMNAIIGLDSLLAKTDLSAKQQDYVEKIGRSASNLLGIINDILDFSKIEAGKLDMEETDFILNDVMGNLSNMIGDKAQAKGIELIFNQQIDIPPNLIGDPLRLGQILLNLTNNAIKFTDSGEIEVSARLLELDEKAVRIRFEVRDTGIGLSEEQIGKLFKSFSQADTSTTRKYGGTGLGLAISKSLSEMMGGEIGVESDEGEGSTFFFTGRFKIGKEKNKPVAPEDLTGLNILVVDDNETARLVLQSYLEDLGFNVKSLSSGELAIREITKAKAAENVDYDLVLMDYQMPGMDGLEAAEKILSSLENIDTPKIVMVTSFGREDIMSRADKINLSGFLIKPVSPSILFDTIMEVFGKNSHLTRNRKMQDSKPQGFEEIRGARILLVEDNEINQQVARETMEQEGFVIEIADDGQMALDMLDDSFDVVLMDLQMPVMDGYEATGEIRKSERYARLPIIAMTADAMTGVRDNVIKTGMNDYVTKPINPGELWAALVKWVEPGKRDLPESYHEESKSDEIDIPPIDDLDIEGGLIRLSGNKKLYIKLLLQFAEEYSDMATELKGYLKTGDRASARRLVHTVKGVAGNMGATIIQASALDLEKSIAEKKEKPLQIEVLNKLISDFISNLNKSGLRNLAEKENDRKKTEIKAHELRAHMDELKESLKKRKPKPAMDVLEKLNDYILPSEIEHHMIQLGECINRYNFKGALDKHRIVEGELTG